MTSKMFINMASSDLSVENSDKLYVFKAPSWLQTSSPGNTSAPTMFANTFIAIWERHHVYKHRGFKVALWWGKTPVLMFANMIAISNPAGNVYKHAKRVCKHDERCWYKIHCRGTVGLARSTACLQTLFSAAPGLIMFLNTVSLFMVITDACHEISNIQPLPWNQQHSIA